MKRSFFVGLIWFLTFSVTSLGNELRRFTDVKGRIIDARVVSVSGENVVLDLKGKHYNFPIKKLIDKDQVYVRRWAKENIAYKFDFRIQATEDATKRKSERFEKNKISVSSWKYDVSMSNRSGVDLKDLEVRYNVILRKTKTAKEKAVSGRQKTESGEVVVGSVKVAEIENSKPTTFATTWVGTEEREWQVQKVDYITDSDGTTAITYWDDYGESTELDGLRVRVYRGEKMVFEWESQGKQIKEMAWVDPGKKPVMPGKNGAPAKMDQVTRTHEDLEPIPAIPGHLRANPKVVDQWKKTVSAGNAYAKLDADGVSDTIRMNLIRRDLARKKFAKELQAFKLSIGVSQ